MELLTLLNEAPIGLLSSDRNGKLSFEYDIAWRNAADALPLSLSLPLTRDRHNPDTVAAVLWGLLPDNENTLQRWAAMFHVSARNPLALLAHVGEDCAGAVKFVSPERFQGLSAGAEDNVQVLDEHSIAERLRQLRVNSGASRRPDDVGQFSLAGAQPKTALLFHDGQWAIPQGRIPTTHILKPPIGEYDGYVENEHFCLNLARQIGLPTCSSQVLRFEDEIAICVERYDRIFEQNRWWRIHQEDFCQALGVMPQSKYENQGGPSPRDLALLMRQQSARPLEDVQTLFLALIYNWLIAGTDAHAKNYSILLGAGGDVRLAPLYDISSALPYQNLQRRKLKMAMKVGSNYRWWDIRTSDWLVLASEMSIDPDFALFSLQAMASALPDEASRLAMALSDQGVEHPVIPRLVDGIAEASGRCLRKLATANAPV
jgi:serine/threonine-protein kinase HipA